MDVLIRQINGSDAAKWQELLRASLGNDYPDQPVYEPEWALHQLDPLSGHETWAAEVNGRLQASVSFLQPASQTKNPVLNLGRQLFRPESFTDGTAELLLRRINSAVPSVKLSGRNNWRPRLRTGFFVWEAGWRKETLACKRPLTSAAQVSCPESGSSWWSAHSGS